jgi:hypothetical protein
MKHTIYKTENLINGKFYIGCHSTEDINDPYLGSGKLLKKAIYKYGRKNFKKEILYVFPSREEALLKETEIVTPEFIKKDNNYNLKSGGEGGWDHINERLKNDLEYKKEFYSKHGHIIRKLHKEGKLTGWKINSDINLFQGRRHSAKSKKLISDNNRNKMPDKERRKRIEDYKKIDKKYGYITKLSKIWGVSHTQVKRFIEEI